MGKKILYLILTLCLLYLSGCQKDESPTSCIDTRKTFTIHVYDYSNRHYFVDTLYADTSKNFNLFWRYYYPYPPTGIYQYKIKSIEVWKLKTNTSQYTERDANAFIDLRVKNNIPYDTERKEEVNYQGKTIIGKFLLMKEGSDYLLNPYTGMISFINEIMETDAIAAAYKIEGETYSDSDDITYGDFIDSIADTSTLVLKLIKPQNVRPSDKIAWKLILKNIYFLGDKNIEKDGFEIGIYYKTDSGELLPYFPGLSSTTKLLNVFSLDLLDDNFYPSPDGKFDFTPGRNIIPETGEIIFPLLQPFGRNFPASLPDSSKFPEVYDTTRTFAKYQTAKDRFIIKGKYKTRN